jgi:hypothetical protein
VKNEAEAGNEEALPRKAAPIGLEEARLLNGARFDPMTPEVAKTGPDM